MTTRGSRADAFFQQHRHNTQNTQLLSSDSSGSSLSIASSSFPDPKEKACGLENKTELLSCEETERNKSTSLHDIRIHHHAFCFPGGTSSVTYFIFQGRIQGEGRRLQQQHLEQVIGNSSSALRESNTFVSATQ
jgi:hypothetical protein